MNRLILLIYFNIFFLNFSYSQKVIEMEKINGVFQIPCKVNGIPMKFIFDTGASNVTISITEAKFLIKQGLIKKEDFIGNVNYQIANGDIKEGTQINIKSIEVDGIILNNILATVVFEQNAPLLLGQTAISKLEPFTIRENSLIIEEFKSDDEKKNYYTTELNATFAWIKDKIQFYQYEDKFEKTEYFFELHEIKTGAFSIIGNSKVTIDNKSNIQIFVLPIHKILDIHFQLDENKEIMLLIVRGNSEDTEYPFIIDDEHQSKFFVFTLHEYLNEEKMQERFTNAFNNLIKYNNLLVKLNNKF